MQEFGDGIMSAIDMFATVDDVVGSAGEKRMVITLNGKVSSVLLIPSSVTQWYAHIYLHRETHTASDAIYALPMSTCEACLSANAEVVCVEAD